MFGDIHASPVGGRKLENERQPVAGDGANRWDIAGHQRGEFD
jgi:hypothetical protein